MTLTSNLIKLILLFFFQPSHSVGKRILWFLAVPVVTRQEKHWQTGLNMPNESETKVFIPLGESWVSPGWHSAAASKTPRRWHLTHTSVSSRLPQARNKNSHQAVGHGFSTGTASPAIRALPTVCFFPFFLKGLGQREESKHWALLRLQINAGLWETVCKLVLLPKKYSRHSHLHCSWELIVELIY